MPDQPPTILIVDDDQGLCRLMERAFRREGWRSTSAASGAEALEQLRNTTPDLTLVDLQLDDMRGQELIDRAKLGPGGIPFVVITGQGDERVAVEMMKRGAIDYIVKDAAFLDLVTPITGRALHQISRDKRLAEAEQAWQRENAERKRLQEELLEITGRERREIGNDLHDGICQQLSAILLMAEALEQSLAKRNKAAAAQANRIAAYMKETIVSAKNLARGLVPVDVASNGLMSALEELASSFTEIYRVDCQFHAPEPILIEDNVTATHLYRIAQEAVSNALRHVKATEIAIELRRQDGAVTLSVSDNGPGFPPELNRPQGMGLRIMRYRAGVIGAAIEFANNPGGGARVSCVLPDKHADQKG